MSNQHAKYTYKLCPDCDYFCNSLEEDRYCPRCGTELITGCPHCNRSIDYPYAQYCKHCGKPLKSTSAVDSATPHK